MLCYNGIFQQTAILRSSLMTALVGLFLETLLSGGLIALYSVILWDMVFNRQFASSRRDISLITASAAMFALAIVVSLLTCIILNVSGMTA